jgi:hypothetical protein
MRVVELYRQYRLREQELSLSPDPPERFRARIAALVAELSADAEALNAAERSVLCRDLGAQLDHDLDAAEDDRRRDVTMALLKAIEDIEFRHGLR